MPYNVTCTGLTHNVLFSTVNCNCLFVYPTNVLSNVETLCISTVRPYVCASDVSHMHGYSRCFFFSLPKLKMGDVFQLAYALCHTSLFGWVIMFYLVCAPDVHFRFHSPFSHPTLQGNMLLITFLRFFTGNVNSHPNRLIGRTRVQLRRNLVD